MSHAHQVAPTSSLNSNITLGDSTAELSNKIHQTIPSHTRKLINATISGKAIVKEATDTVFSDKNSFLNKIYVLSANTKHPSQDETYFGLNYLDQATLVSKSNELNVYFFNESDVPLTISGNCIIGSIMIPEPHATIVDMNSVMTIVMTSSETFCSNNTPSAKHAHSALAHGREYVLKVFDIPNSPTLQANPNITGQLVDLIMIFGMFFTEKVIVGVLK